MFGNSNKNFSTKMEMSLFKYVKLRLLHKFQSYLDDISKN